MTTFSYNIEYLEIAASSLEVVSLIGSGSQGDTYVVKYQGRPACAKVFNQEKEMLQEVLMLDAAKSSLCSPNLFGVCTSLRLVIMELAPGTNLHYFLGTRPCRVSVHRVMVALGQAIERIHFAGIILNDLKFDNIMVSENYENPRITLVDFAWATFKRCVPYPHINPAEIENFPHVCPRLASGGECDSNTDNYSFGVLLQTIADSYKCPLFAVLARMLTMHGGIMFSLQSLLQYIRDDYCYSCQHSCPCPNCIKF